MALATRGSSGQPRARTGTGTGAGAWAQAVGHLQLYLSIHLRILLGFLVAVVQVFHEHGHHHVDEHELSCEYEAHEVQGRHELQAAQAAALIVGAISQSILPQGQAGEVSANQHTCPATHLISKAQRTMDKGT